MSIESTSSNLLQRFKFNLILRSKGFVNVPEQSTQGIKATFTKLVPIQYCNSSYQVCIFQQQVAFLQQCLAHSNK